MPKSSKLKKLFTILKDMSTAKLVYLFLGIGFGCIFLGVLFLRAGDLGRILAEVLVPFAFFVWGFMGLPMITRKEMPWLITIHGWPAVLEGVLLIVIDWGVAVLIWGTLLRLWQ